MPILSEIKRSKKWQRAITIFLIVIGMAAGAWFSMQPEKETVGFNRYTSDVKKGLVEKVEVTSDFLSQTVVIHLKDKTQKPYTVTGPHLNYEEALKLADQGIDVIYPPLPADFSKYLSNTLLVCLMFYLFFMLYQMLPTGFSFKSPVKKQEDSITFDDIAGASEGKRAMQRVVSYFNDPSKFKKIGAKFSKGVLLVGPPGNGKTLLARASANEAKVPMLTFTPSDFNSPFMAISGVKLKRAFKRAKALSPCLVFIDEIDAIGGSRLSEGTAAAREQGATLTSLLVIMDGFESNSGVVVVAATNRLEVLDPALIRSGRFDRIIHVNHPNITERQQILEIHAKAIKIAPDFDFHAVAHGTFGMSGADLANVMNQAAECAVFQGEDEVTTKHALIAKNDVRLGEVRLETRALLDDKSRRIFALHEASHAVVEIALGQDVVRAITILPRGKSLGHTESTPEKERVLHGKDYLLSKLRVLVAGRKGEEMLEGVCTTGAENDIEVLNRLAGDIVRKYGMSSLGMVSVNKDSSGYMTGEADKEVGKLISEAEKDAILILFANKVVIESMVDALLSKETIESGEVSSYINKVKKSGDLKLYYHNSIGNSKTSQELVSTIETEMTFI